MIMATMIPMMRPVLDDDEPEPESELFDDATNQRRNNWSVNLLLGLYDLLVVPLGKSAEKCRSVFLKIWYCILSAKLTKTHSFGLFYCRFCPLRD